jgi:hypothetical protein
MIPPQSLYTVLPLSPLLLAALLAASTVHRLTGDGWSLELVYRCYLGYHASIQAVALACPGVDYTRLWPLPVTQPWNYPPDMPPGCYAGKLTPLAP